MEKRLLTFLQRTGRMVQLENYPSVQLENYPSFLKVVSSFLANRWSSLPSFLSWIGILYPTGGSGWRTILPLACGWL